MTEVTSEVGVDINALIRLPHVTPLLQFVPGLGPRKARALIGSLGDMIKSRPPLHSEDIVAAIREPSELVGDASARKLYALRGIWPTPLVSRQQLLKREMLGRVVYNNAASFIRIPDPVMSGAGLHLAFDMDLDGPETPGDEQRNPLDATALHPDSYTLAFQIVTSADKNLPTEEQLANVVGEPIVDIDFSSPRTFRCVVRHVARCARHSLLGTLRDWTAGSFTQFVDPVGSREGQIVAGPGSSMPPELYFPGALREPGIVPDNVLMSKRTLDPNIQAPEEPEDLMENQDLPAFAEIVEQNELTASGGQSHLVRRALHRLSTIVQELRQPSTPFLQGWAPPTAAATFRLLTGENAASLRPGTVQQAEITKVFDFRVVVRLPCGVSGSVNADAVIDPGQLPPGQSLESVNLSSMFSPHQRITVRVGKVTHESFGVILNAQKGRVALPPPMLPLDPFVDAVALRLLESSVRAELNELVRDAQDERIGAFRARAANGASLTLRPINHPQFANVTRSEAEAQLGDSALYSCLVRPSSKGPNHLTITWKFAPAPLFVHINVDEEDKDVDGPDGVAVLGRKLICGKKLVKRSDGNKAFESRVYSSLDELLARHMDRMSAHLRDFVATEYFRAAPKEGIEAELKERKLENPTRVAYLLHYATEPEKIGQLAVSLIASNSTMKVMTEKVLVNPEGFLWAHRQTRNVAEFVSDFKRRLPGVLQARSRPSSTSMSPRKSRWGASPSSGGGASPGAGAWGSQPAQGYAVPQPPMAGYAAPMPPASGAGY